MAEGRNMLLKSYSGKRKMNFLLLKFGVPEDTESVSRFRSIASNCTIVIHYNKVGDLSSSRGPKSKVLTEPVNLYPFSFRVNVIMGEAGNITSHFSILELIDMESKLANHQELGSGRVIHKSAQVFV